MTEQNTPRYPPRYIPGSDAEFQKDVTRPSWADRGQMPGLDQKVTKKYLLTDSKGKPVLDSKGEQREISESLLNIYEMFTQDIRLGNMDKEEIEWCRLHIDLAHDLLQCGYNESSLVVLERGISVIETSHSKKGWLRELQGTITNRQYNEYREPTKSIWTGKDGGK